MLHIFLNNVIIQCPLQKLHRSEKPAEWLGMAIGW
jgi:hypothetical protein